MRSELLHIYGPFSIHSYGLFIIIGLIAFVEFIKRDKRFIRLGIEKKLNSIIMVGAAIGLLGGRLLYIITEQNQWCLADICAFWNGGYSVLGGVVALALFEPLYLRYCKIPILPFADIIGIYAPLLLAISRLGCYVAGCCYGIPTTSWLGVYYSDTSCLAPLGIRLHPTQLYSAALLFAIFLLFYGLLRNIFQRPGQLFFCYLAFQGSERFIVDFWRADRLLFSGMPWVSLHQLIAIGLMATGIIGFFAVSRRNRAS